MRLSRCLAAAYSLALLLVPMAGHTEQAAVEHIRAATHPEYLRVVLDLSEPTQYNVFSLSNPPRLVIDLDRTDNRNIPAPPTFQNTHILKMRSGIRDESNLRLVFDLSQALETRSFPLKPHGLRGDRIVIDFYHPQISVRETNIDEVLTPIIDTPAEKKLPRSPATHMTVRNDPTPRTSRRSAIGLSGTWEQEWAVAADDFGAQKFESRVEPRLDLDLPGDLRLTGSVRLRADTVGDLGPDDDKPDNYSDINGPFYNDENAEFSLRELYLDGYWGKGFWRLGKQQVVWGQADGLRVMDAVNPHSYREWILDDFDNSRIPLWMVNAELPAGEDGTLQFLWIPDTTYHELAEVGTPYEITSRLLVPRAPEGLATQVNNPDTPDHLLEDSDAGLRYSGFLSGWDVTLNYLYHYQDFPVLYQDLQVAETGMVGVLSPEYERNHLIGATLSNAFGDATLRAELVYNTDSFHLANSPRSRGIASSEEFTSVIGLDWQLASLDTLLSAQWFQSHLPDHDQTFLRSTTENMFSLLYRRDFNNETWNLQALGLYSLDHNDRQLQLKLSHLLRSNLEIWLGGDLFGGDKDGTFGQFGNEDRILMGMELGF